MNISVKSADTRRQLVDLITGGWRAQAIYTAVRLRIPDLIGAGQNRLSTLTEATGANPSGLHRLMRYLISIGIFAGDGQSGYLNTELSRGLAEGPDSLRDMSLLYGEQGYAAWGNAHMAISEERSGFQEAFGETFYAYLGQNPEIAQRFQRVMNAQNIFAEAVPHAFDFSGGKHVVDVGGGGGRLLAEILSATPDAHGTLFDRDHILPQARAYLGAAVGAERVSLVAGDMFKELPEGGDVYLFSRVLAGWSDEPIIEVLRNCRRAMKESGARVLIIDRLVSDENPSPLSSLWDLHLLMTIGGRHRSREGFLDLLERAGFTIEQISELPSETTAILAAPCQE